MVVDVFEEMFGSKEKARLIRFFLFNPRTKMTAADLADKARLRPDAVRRGLNSLMKMGMVRDHARKRVKEYSLDPGFPYLLQLHNLLAASNTLEQCKSLARLRRSAAVKFAAVSGLFTDNPKATIDLLIVVSDTKRAKIQQSIDYIEAEVGKEVRYALLDVDEFRYRMEMLDRFLKDFFEGGYQEIVNKIPGLSRTIQSLHRK